MDKANKFLIFLLLVQLAIGDELSQPVEVFARQSLLNLTSHKEPIDFERSIFVYQTPTSIYSIGGVLSDIQLFGLDGIRDITTEVKSITQGGFAGLEYRVILTSPVLRGKFNLTGTIGSTLPLNGTGDFEIRPIIPFEFGCYNIMSADAGYVSLQDGCFITSSNMSFKGAALEFPGFGEEHVDIDSGLRQGVLEKMIDSTNGLISDAVEALKRTINAHLISSFKKQKLLNILEAGNSSTTSSHESKSHNLYEVNHQEQEENEIDQRFNAFVTEIITSLSKEVDEKFQLNQSYAFDNTRGVLFPTAGILSNLHLTGLRTMQNIKVSSRLNSYNTIQIEFELRNVSLSGQYNINGSVVGEQLRAFSNDFSISSSEGLHFIVDANFNNVNGHLVYERSYLSGINFHAEDYISNFPGLYEGLGLSPKLQSVAVNSIGLQTFCPVDQFCSLTFIREPIVNLVVSYLDNVFKAVSIVDILKLV